MLLPKEKKEETRNNFERFEKVDEKKLYLDNVNYLHRRNEIFINTPVPRIVWTIYNSRV